MDTDPDRPPRNHLQENVMTDHNPDLADVPGEYLWYWTEPDRGEP